MEYILNRIRNADSMEIDQIFDLALKRKREVYPDWAIYYAAVPKNNREEREETIKELLYFLEKEGERG